MQLPNLFLGISMLIHIEDGKLLLKGPNSNYFRLAGHMVSVTPIQFSHCSVKAALGYNIINEWV